MGMLITQRTRLVSVMSPVVAGTSSQNGSAVDMSQNGGYRGVRFIAHIGALTGSQTTSMKVQGSPDNADYTTLGGDLKGTGSGNMADADSNKIIICDVYRPTLRYNRPVVVRGVANAVIDCVIAELYDPITEPTTADTSVSKSSTTVSPPLGTA